MADVIGQISNEKNALGQPEDSARLISHLQKGQFVNEIQRDSATNVPYFRVEANQAINILKTAWLLAKNNYGVMLGIACVQVLFLGVLSGIPMIGGAASSVVGVILSAGTLAVGRKCVQGEKPKFEDLFFALLNSDILKKIAPFAVLMGVLAIINTIISTAIETFLKNFAGDLPATVFGILGLSISVMFVSLIGYFTLFVLPLMIFKDLKVMDAINDSVAVTVKEWWTLFLVSVTVVAYGAITVLLFVLPMIFIYLPGIVCFSYLLYAAYFENLDIEVFHEKLRSSPQV